MLLLAPFAHAQVNGNTAYDSAVLGIQASIEQGSFDTARQQLASASKLFPANGGLENLLGIVDIQQGHADEARKDFTAAVRDSPQLVGAKLNLARLDLQEAIPAANTRALQLYDRVLRIEPANAEANVESATLLTQTQHFAEALSRLGHLAADTRTSGRVEALLCADHAGTGQLKAAEQDAARLQANPDTTEADLSVALDPLRFAHRADIIQSLYAAIAARAPLSASGARILGLAQEANGDLAAARATLEHAYEADPTSTAVLTDLSRIAVSQHDDKGALGYIAHARALSPKDSSLPYEFGVICFRMNMLGEARKALGEAVDLQPANPQYNLALGTVSTFAQDPLQGVPYLLKYNSMRPDDARGDLTIGIAYAAAKDDEKARPWLLKAAASPGTAAAAHYQLGSLLRQKGEYDAALVELQKSNAEKKDQPEVLAELGQTYLQMRNYDDAQKQLTSALSLDPDNYAANFALLQLYAHNQDPRRAEQSKRFDALRDRHEQQYRDAMRVIEVRPVTESEASR